MDHSYCSPWFILGGVGAFTYYTEGTDNLEVFSSAFHTFLLFQYSVCSFGISSDFKTGRWSEVL